MWPANRWFQSLRDCSMFSGKWPLFAPIGGLIGLEHLPKLVSKQHAYLWDHNSADGNTSAYIFWFRPQRVGLLQHKQLAEIFVIWGQSPLKSIALRLAIWATARSTVTAFTFEFPWFLPVRTLAMDSRGQNGFGNEDTTMGQTSLFFFAFFLQAMFCDRQQISASFTHVWHVDINSLANGRIEFWDV